MIASSLSGSLSSFLLFPSPLSGSFLVRCLHYIIYAGFCEFESLPRAAHSDQLGEDADRDLGWRL